jgi:16S rRNA (guanine966-N2)-methyltransferase
MRVIAGQYRGRTLHSPRSHSYRPTTDRVKESLFNILDNLVTWEGLRVCDLFAGSGALGIEAVSRGAATVTFVDSDRQSIAILRRNVDAIAPSAEFEVATMPVHAFLSRTASRFGLILADPPYEYGEYAALCSLIAARNALMPGGLLVIEHHGKTALPAMDGWRLADRREYGTTAVSFLEPAPPISREDTA